MLYYEFQNYPQYKLHNFSTAEVVLQNDATIKFKDFQRWFATATNCNINICLQCHIRHFSSTGKLQHLKLILTFYHRSRNRPFQTFCIHCTTANNSYLRFARRDRLVSFCLCCSTLIVRLFTRPIRLLLLLFCCSSSKWHTAVLLLYQHHISNFIRSFKLKLHTLDIYNVCFESVFSVFKCSTEFCHYAGTLI